MQTSPESPKDQILHLVKITRSNIKNWDCAEVEKYIYHGELELALDGIAYDYLSQGVTVAPDFKNIMASLADEMKMLNDPEWDSVRKLLVEK